MGGGGPGKAALYPRGNSAPTCKDEGGTQDQHLHPLQSRDGHRGLPRLPGTLTHFSNTYRRKRNALKSLVCKLCAPLLGTSVRRVLGAHSYSTEKQTTVSGHPHVPPRGAEHTDPD